jgi:hypothetical protein
VELNPPTEDEEKAAARLQGTLFSFTRHHQYKGDAGGQFIYKQKPFKPEANEEEQLVNEILFQTRNRNR